MSDCKFKAVNDKQLGTCLRMLSAENVNPAIVESVLNDKGKMEFYISTNISAEEFEKLLKQYETLIS